MKSYSSIPYGNQEKEISVTMTESEALSYLRWLLEDSDSRTDAMRALEIANEIRKWVSA